MLLPPVVEIQTIEEITFFWTSPRSKQTHQHFQSLMLAALLERMSRGSIGSTKARHEGFVFGFGYIALIRMDGNPYNSSFSSIVTLITPQSYW